MRPGKPTAWRLRTAVLVGLLFIGLFGLFALFHWSLAPEPARFEAVLAALANPQCHVPDDDLRPHLAAGCAAHDMAELAVFGDVCGVVVQGFAGAVGHPAARADRP